MHTHSWWGHLHGLLLMSRGGRRGVRRATDNSCNSGVRLDCAERRSSIKVGAAASPYKTKKQPLSCQISRRDRFQVMKHPFEAVVPPRSSIWILKHILKNKSMAYSSQVGLGGLGVTCSPRDPRFAGSNPTEVDGYFLGRKNYEHKSSGRDFKLGVPSLRFRAR